MHENINWEERYQQGGEALPWDIGTPAEELVEFFEMLESDPGRALEIGCGTGTNAIWMAARGVEVVATDISPTAIDTAREKSRTAGVSVEFKVSDILAEIPADGAVDFVFDRGVFHVMEAARRVDFARRVAEMLGPGGYWLCLAGSADEKLSHEVGPPQLKAGEVILACEESFEIHRLERAAFVLPDGAPRLAWKVVFRKRD